MSIKNFLHEESGAVTVDWVVLTAALVGLGLAVMAVISSGLQNQSEDVESLMSDGTIIRTAFTGSIASARDTACGTFGGCDDTLNQAGLQALSTDELNGLPAVDYTSGLETSYGLAGLSQNADGAWGDGTDPDNFIVDDGATSDYNTALSAETSQNQLISAEQGARVN